MKFLNQNITDFKVEDMLDLMFFGITAYGILFPIIFCNFKNY